MLASGAGLIFVYGPPDVELRYTLYPTAVEVLGFQRRLTVCDDVAVPDPVKVSTAGVFAALLVREMLPDAAPLLCGVKATETGTLWPAAMVLGRDNPVRRNSGLVEVAEEMVTFDPVAVSVVVTLLLLPTTTLPKFRALTLEVNCPAETPVPTRAMTKVGFEAFETTAIAPLTLPPAFGVNRIAKVMLWPLFRLNGRLRPLTPNPAPVTVARETVAVELPEFVNVSYWVWPLPTWMLPKLMLDELAVSVRWFESVP